MLLTSYCVVNLYFKGILRNLIAIWFYSPAYCIVPNSDNVTTKLRNTNNYSIPDNSYSFSQWNKPFHTLSFTLKRIIQMDQKVQWVLSASALLAFTVAVVPAKIPIPPPFLPISSLSRGQRKASSIKGQNTVLFELHPQLFCMGALFTCTVWRGLPVLSLSIFCFMQRPYGVRGSGRTVELASSLIWRNFVYLSLLPFLICIKLFFFFYI